MRDFVDVIRCEKCKYYLSLEDAAKDESYMFYPFQSAIDIGADGLCTNTDKWTCELDYCSDGAYDIGDWSRREEV